MSVSLDLSSCTVQIPLGKALHVSCFQDQAWRPCLQEPNRKKGGDTGIQDAAALSFPPCPHPWVLPSVPCTGESPFLPVQRTNTLSFLLGMGKGFVDFDQASWHSSSSLAHSQRQQSQFLTLWRGSAGNAEWLPGPHALPAENTTFSDLFNQLVVSLVLHLLPRFRNATAVICFPTLFVLVCLYPPFLPWHFWARLFHGTSSCMLQFVVNLSTRCSEEGALLKEGCILHI